MFCICQFLSHCTQSLSFTLYSYHPFGSVDEGKKSRFLSISQPRRLVVVRRTNQLIGNKSRAKRPALQGTRIKRISNNFPNWFWRILIIESSRRSNKSQRVNEWLLPGVSSNRSEWVVITDKNANSYCSCLNLRLNDTIYLYFPKRIGRTFICYDELIGI